jgi:dephospho-CoA kinase
MTSAGLASRRAVVLITGMSGTGKSTVLQELALRGHRVVDTDIGGWIVEQQNSDGSEPVWDLDRIHALLDSHRAGWLFVAGCVANQGLVYERFDRIVLLSAPLDVVLERVQRRSNPFGSTAADRERIAADLAEVEPMLRAGADHEIVTTASRATVVSAIEEVAATVPFARS